MKHIETLVPDILALFGGSNEAIDPDRLISFAGAMASKVGFRLQERRLGGSLRLSAIGKPECQLWWGVNQPELGEPIEPENKVKFLFGDILEEMLLYLAEEAGHTVTDQQKEVEIDGVLGHIDGLIDGVLVDCKSASPIGFQKFVAGLKPGMDDFGYLGQLNSYLHVLGLPRGGFLAIEKVSGHIALDLHDYVPVDLSAVIAHKRSVLAATSPPARAFTAKADGKSGNKCLDTVCSYCPHKEPCWADANGGKGLRKFFYSGKPRWLTEVRRTPKVEEDA